MDHIDIIRNLGGVSDVALICGITPSAVSQWKESGIPRPWLMFFKAAFPSECGLDAAPNFRQPLMASKP
ncbi:Cro/CI family transcriptional regulator [Chromobacterium sinusclupearum]|uniref:Cro/CI family transcriptional regulator n=1 Tax=Chromobacterium sinusclupearum TaxID=2077146 RepID=UPI0011AF3F36